MELVSEQSIPIAAERSTRRVALAVAVCAVAAACLAWVLRHFEWQQFLSDLAVIEWKWIIPAVFFDVASYLCQGLRWHYVLQPLGAPPVMRATQAIYVGLFTNEIIPLRGGEVVRAYMVSRWTGLGMPVVLTSVGVERLLDAIWLALGFGVTALVVDLPPVVRRGAQALGVFSLVCTVFLVATLAAGQRLTHALERTRAGRRGPLAWLLHFIDHLIDGLRQIGHSASLYRAVGATLLLLVTQILAMWFMMLGYRLHYSFWVASAVLLILHLGTAIPNAPANIGSYQVSCVIGLTLFGVDRTTAAHFSVVSFLILTVPLLVFGFISVLQSGVSLADIRQQVRQKLNSR